MLWESFFGSAQHLRLMNMQEWNATQAVTQIRSKKTKYRKIIKSLNWSNRKKLTTRDYIMDHALLGLSQSVSEVSVRYDDYCNFIPWTCYPVPCIRYSQLSTKHYPQSLHPSLHRVVHHFQRFVGLLLHHLCWWCGSSLIDSDQVVWVAQIKGKYSSIVC